MTDKPDSPHLLVPKMKAQYHIAIAADDDKAQPDAKDKPIRPPERWSMTAQSSATRSGL